MLVSTTLDRGDSVSPSAAERSRRELTRKDCLAWEIVSGGREIRVSWPGGEGSRPLGIRSRLGKGVQRGMRSGLRERRDLEDSGVFIKHCISHIVWPSVQLPLPQHLLSFLCLSIPIPLRFFSPPTRSSLCRMQTKGASGVEVLLAFGSPLGPCAAFWSKIFSVRLSQPL